MQYSCRHIFVSHSHDLKKTFLQRIYTYGQYTHEKGLNVSHLWNAYQNHSEISLHNHFLPFSCYIMSKSFMTPCTVTLQASLSVKFSRPEYWSGLPFPSPGDLPDPGMEPKSAARQASLSITNSRSLLKLMPIELVIPSSHLLLCHPLLLLLPIPPSIRSFPVSQLFTWGGQSIGASTSSSVLPMNTQDWSPLGWTGWISLQSKGLSRVFPNTIVQKHQFFSAQLSSQSNSHIHTWALEKP